MSFRTITAAALLLLSSCVTTVAPGGFVTVRPDRHSVDVIALEYRRQHPVHPAK